MSVSFGYQGIRVPEHHLLITVFVTCIVSDLNCCVGKRLGRGSWILLAWTCSSIQKKGGKVRSWESLCILAGQFAINVTSNMSSSVQFQLQSGYQVLPPRRRWDLCQAKLHQLGRRDRNLRVIGEAVWRCRAQEFLLGFG